MAGKKLTALEMPDDEDAAPAASRSDTVQETSPRALAASSSRDVSYEAPSSIPLPPIPPPPQRRVMVQLSIKAPLDLVQRLELMARQTGAQKQAVIAAALDAYMRGHSY